MLDAVLEVWFHALAIAAYGTVNDTPHDVETLVAAFTFGSTFLKTSALQSEVYWTSFREFTAILPLAITALVALSALSLDATVVQYPL
jgi:hypothetical protein